MKKFKTIKEALVFASKMDGIDLESLKEDLDELQISNQNGFVFMVGDYNHNN